MVLWGRKNTGGIFCEGTGRTVGIVEIQNDLAILDWLRVVISTGRVCLFPAGQVFEFDKQFVIFYFGHIQFVGFALKPETDITIHAVFDDVSKGIGLV
jgi:hypothetical protein